MLDRLLDANQQILRQALEASASLNDRDLAARPATVSCGSIGEHLRHVADHYDALLHPVDGVIDYTRRHRGTAMERNPQIARQRLQALRERLPALDEGSVAVRTDLNGVDDGLLVPSRISRELAFVGSHAIHHLALVAVIMRSLGKPVPPELGVAPATLRWRQQQTGHAAAPESLRSGTG